MDTEWPVAPLPGEDWAAWLLALQLLYLHQPPPPLTWRNVVPLVYLVDKYDVAALRPACESFMLAADFAASPDDLTPHPVWPWLVAAARCGMGAVVDKCCAWIGAKRLAVPDGFCLGTAAQLLAESVLKQLAAADRVRLSDGCLYHVHSRAVRWATPCI